MTLYLKLLTAAIVFQYSLFRTPYQKLLVFWDEVIMVLLFCGVVAIKINKGQQFISSPLDKSILSFISLIVLSLLINQSPLYPFIYSIKILVIYILLYYCIINSKINLVTLSKVIYFIFILFLIQVPIIIADLILTISTESFKGLEPDAFQGTFPGANILSTVALIPIFLLLGYKSFRLKSRYEKILFSLFIFLLIVGQGRFAILLFIFIVSYIFRGEYRKHTQLKIDYLYKIIVPIIIIMMIYFAFSIQTFSEAYDLWYQVKVREFNVGSGSQRFLYYPLTYSILVNEGIINFLFGLGPGMYGSYAGIISQTPWTVYLGNVFGQLDRGFHPEVSSQFIPIWGEFGLLGIISFYWIHIKVFIISKQSYLNNKQPLVKSISLALLSLSLLMILGSFIHNYYEVQVIQFFYWLLCGLLININRYDVDRLNSDNIDKVNKGIIAI